MRKAIAAALGLALPSPLAAQTVVAARLEAPAGIEAPQELPGVSSPATMMALPSRVSSLAAPSAADGFAAAQALTPAVASVLTPDLLKPQWRKADKPAPYGHCYAACEALFHMSGGKAAGWKPMHVKHEGSSHWFLEHESGGVLDPTAAQFKTPVPYGKGVGGGFLTRLPSKRAAEIIRRVKAAAQIHPERTAMPRGGPSVPARRAQPLMRGDVLDYGAGRGADTRFLKKKGLRVTAYDPYFAPEKPAAGKRFDWVMLNYVLNVIAEPDQRKAALRDVSARLKPGGRVLVAVRGAAEIDAERGKGWKRRGDGWLTPRGTFQHGYAQEELRAALAESGLEIERQLSPLVVVARKASSRAARFGKETPAAVYFHKSWAGRAPARLAAVVEKAESLLPSGARWNVIKVTHDGRAVSFLRYPDFDSDPHPALRYVYRVDLKTRTLTEDDQSRRANPFILHRKDSFVSPSDPRYAAFRRLTEKEEAAGLLNRNDIGTRDGWARALKAARRRSS